jgi:hypothetical protein
MTTLPVIWVLMGLRFMAPARAKRANGFPTGRRFQPKSRASPPRPRPLMMSASIALILIAFPLRPSTNRRVIPTNIVRRTKSGVRPSATDTLALRIKHCPQEH